MRLMQYVGAAVGVLVAGAVWAQSGEAVVKSKGCMNCHAMDTKKVGPSFKDIAAKKPDAAAATAKIKDAKGHPKVSASEAEIKAAVSYILSVK
jgi:cytochrome c